MRVLFYYPSNKRTIAFNSVIKGLKKNGYDMYLLTTCEEGAFHKDCKELGIKVFSNPIPNKKFYYLKQIIFLIRFCKEHNIETILSNLQHVNFISVFAQFFVKSKVIIYRHHFNYVNLLNPMDLYIKRNRNEELFDRIINRLAKKIIVPSKSVKEGMVKYEEANPNKISIMQYLYDFELYNKPDSEKVRELNSMFKAELILLMCARLIKLKGHSLVFNVIKKLVKERGLNIKMLVLDDGPERVELDKFILENQLENHIFMFGYYNDIVTVMEVCDLMIHPSLTEASNSAVKEMALRGKTAIVCDGVGDFSDYFINRVNGFLINPNHIESEIEEILLSVYEDKMQLNQMGANLRNTVLKRFEVTNENLGKFINGFKN